MHKRFLLLFLTLLSSVPLFAQLEVKEGSFKKVDGFVNLNPNIQSDDNDVLYAVVKIRTENINDKQRHELLFEGNLATFIEVEYKVGEVWIYLSSSPATYLKISHPDLSSTEFWFPYDLEPKQGYELTIVNKFNYAPVSEISGFNYLIVKADQNNAMIYFDDVFIGQQEASKLYKVGEKHRWRIDCENYHSEEGESEIILGDPIMIEKVLRPAFGYINVTSEPEIGALVFVDGKNVGTTPYKSGMIKSGLHTVKIVKEMYNEQEQTITVTDGNTTDVKLAMSAKFVNVTVQTDSESDIYIDNKKVGKGSWTGRLYDGDHVFEAKKASHRTSTKNARIILGKDEKIIIPDPVPIYGSLNVTSNPMGASIIVDGKDYGTTPRVINKVLIGKHSIKIDKKGCNPETREVDVTENTMIDVNVTLSVGESVTITTTPSNAKIYIDGQQAGVSPLKTVLSYGNHTISAQKGKKSAYKSISISKYVSTCHLTLEKETLSSYVQNGYKFITLNGAINQYGDLSYGLTIGSMRKFGWFASFMTNFNFDTKYDYECDTDHYVTVDGNLYYPKYTGNEAFSSFSFIGGVLMRLSGPVAMRVGVGYGMKVKRYETDNGYWVKNKAISTQGLDASLGLQCNFRGFIISIDCVTSSFKTYEAKIGLGYGLKNK